MTPKEKARELFDKFNKGEILYWQVDKFGAIEAALITVNEILEVVSYDNNYKATWITDEETSTYWVDVKNEIKKL